MKKGMKSAFAATLALTACFCGISAYAAHDENLNVYTLDTVVVEADKTKNKFGDTITEQSYYRTGGDVKVITREELDKRHYTDVTEAIKRIPGITFQNPGYRGGEYGYQFYNNGISINGDTRVVVLVDGRRVDNAASSRIDSSSAAGSKSTGVNLDQVTNMENVDKIEVIKGPGASVYGDDATGGVINIITRKGGRDSQGSIDLATGSWKKHHYAINYSGSAGNDRSWHYFISTNRDMSGDTKYHDAFSDTDGRLEGSRWKEDGVNVRLDKDFSDTQNLKIWYNFRQGKDGYPIATPNQKYMNPSDWANIISRATIGGFFDTAEHAAKGKDYKSDGVVNLADMDDNRTYFLGKTMSGDMKNPGYHNLYSLDGNYGSFSRFKNNDLDIVYTFNKDNGMDSFIRFYNQTHRLSNRDVYHWYKYGGTKQAIEAFKRLYPSGATGAQIKEWIKENLAPFTGNKELLKKWIADTGGYATEPNSWHEEKNRGVQLQYAKSIGKHDVIANVTYDKAKNYAYRVNPATGEKRSSSVERKTVRAYVQDKIHLTDKWDLTPSLRYSHYSDYKESTGGNGAGNTNDFNYSLNTEYMFNDKVGMYLGWTKGFRPLRQGDYTTTDYVFNAPLEDEEGNIYTFGIHYDISDRTTVALHYDWTKMKNAIATLPVLDPNSGDFLSTPINGKEDKQSINLTLDHQLNKHVTLSASYSHMKDKWKAKDGWTLGPESGWDPDDINTGINHLRPQNHYALNVSYENARFYTGLLLNYYTGCSGLAFTDNRFLILDWNANYEFANGITAYVTVGNLTNESYETSYNSWNGLGSSAMPGRYFMVGTKYKF